MKQHPLSNHPPEDVIAYRHGESITAGQFHQEAIDLAAELPASNYIINSCQDRYLFMLGFAAAVLAGKTTLMPSSFAPQTILQLKAAYPDLVCLHDGRDRAVGIPEMQISPRPVGTLQSAPAPLLNGEQVAAIVFTSGSTGSPTAHTKRWGRLCMNGAAESHRLRARGMAIVATVPPQHMYGFESSVLLALHGGASIWHGKPFFPADIAEALSAVSRPRMLVTTPFHLATLLDSGLSLPECDMVLSATAPLPMALATRAEKVFSSPLLEIYGCTESGQVASRQPTKDPAWQLLPDVQMRTSNAGASVFGGHVEGEVPLSDYIEPTDFQRFILLGRHADMVNIVGKRTSLAHLNAQLLSIPGVEDGCFLQPEEGTGKSSSDEVLQRLAAIVVAPTLGADALMEQLRSRIDPVFLPRPLIKVDAIPRNATGKIVRSELLALYSTHRLTGRSGSLR